eukprot:scaffold7863_cov37-Cyclotella_meneghiniana.AAC.10
MLLPVNPLPSTIDNYQASIKSITTTDQNRLKGWSSISTMPVRVLRPHLNKLQIRLPRKPVASAPTKRYGDHICQADQDETLCPSDCVNTKFFTYDDLVGVKGSNDTLDKVCT